MLYLVIKAALSGIIIADSGGPAFLKHKGQLCIAAVSSSQDDGGLGEGRYGVRELYPRVSHYRGWLHQVMKEKPAGQRG